MTHQELAIIDSIQTRLKELESKVEELESLLDNLRNDVDHPSGCECNECGTF